MYIGYPLFFSHSREITRNPSTLWEKNRRKNALALALKADAAKKRGDHDAEERYLTQAMEEGYGFWSDLAYLQHKRGEYQAEFATRGRYMERQEFCGRSKDGPLRCEPGEGWGGQSKNVYDLLRYVEVADRVAPQESPRIWKRLVSAMNENGSMGKTLPVVAGHTLNRKQIHTLAKAVNALWGGSIEEPKPAYPQQLEAVRAALKAVPECDPARLWLANDLYARRYADEKGTPSVREAERQYKILAHSSDAEIRREARGNLDVIAAQRAEAAKWVPVSEELNYAYARSAPAHQGNGKYAESHDLP